MITPDWSRLESNHPAPLVERLKALGEEGGPFRTTAAELAAATSDTRDEALRLLRSPELSSWLREEVALRCPHCQRALTPEEAAGNVCPDDSSIAFVDHGGVVEETVFTHDAPLTRDVRWVLLLHGMNTRGWWQEELNWLVSLSYGRMVPVATHKYGVVRPGAILRFRQRQIMIELNAKIRRYSGETDVAGFGSRPDVIAHSFGTWLLGHALLADPALRVGRVILLGCILRPDFDWSRLIGRGQVEAVLNNFGTADRWSRAAQRFIPCSGPSGYRGFDDPAVLNSPIAGFGHSQFFTEEALPGLFQKNWRTFLTASTESLPELTGLVRPERSWRAGWLRVTAGRNRCTLMPAASCH